MAEIKGYKMPDELYYHEEHSWARIEGEEITVGNEKHQAYGTACRQDDGSWKIQS